ncbi:MAG: DUF1638 domain-containing protein [Ignavibacteriae bacterium]|nr:DUF1638 domain-containing protein [Ignavibacteriota bacterium]
MQHTNTDGGSSSAPAQELTFLIGCGILAREIRSLIRKNHWPLEPILLDPDLHNDFCSLERALASSLTAHRSDSTVVFYGCCHPRIDDIVAGAQTVRTQGQNCIEMLLGHDVFSREVEQGAYFLMEAWARNWHRVIANAFGTTTPDVIRSIFNEDRRYLLALRTPCTGDFTGAAEEAGRVAGLPVRWMDVSLDALEDTLRTAIVLRSSANVP